MEMKKFEIIDDKIGYFVGGKFVSINISVKYWRHHCDYIDECISLDQAIEFARSGHDDDDMSFEGIIVDGKTYETRDAYFHSHIYDTWKELKEKIIDETVKR